jgi:SAM-dependent methyltransferase
MITAEEFYDRHAERYDDTYFAGEPYWEFYRARVWETLKPHLPREAGAPVLDAGGGTGHWTLRLAKSGYRVTLLDVSRRMLEVARRKIAVSGLTVADVRHGDIAGLEGLPDEHFALALAEGDPISCCSSPREAARALHRVLRPGGRVVASVDGTWAGLSYYLEKGHVEELERYVRDGRTWWLAHRAEERFPLHTFTPDSLRTLFERAGFRVLRITGKTVLPVRKHPELLRDPQSFRRLLRLERSLAAEPALLGGAAHLVIEAGK